MIKKLQDYYKYCSENLTDIEGFADAVNDRTDSNNHHQGWVLHHRLETHNSDGERRDVQLTQDELIALGMYYDRPANELIFMTKADHNKIHTCGRKSSLEHIKTIVEKTQKPVRNIELNIVYPSLKAAMESINKKSRGGILGCCKGYYETSGGYHWEYA